MAGNKRNGATVPDWFKTVEPGAKLKAHTFFKAKPDDPGKFGNEVRVSTTWGAGRLDAKNGETVTVAFGENLRDGAIFITAHPSKFEPV